MLAGTCPGVKAIKIDLAETGTSPVFNIRRRGLRKGGSEARRVAVTPNPWQRDPEGRRKETLVRASERLWPADRHPWQLAGHQPERRPRARRVALNSLKPWQTSKLFLTNPKGGSMRVEWL
jgi:hypothetical protein